MFDKNDKRLAGPYDDAADGEIRAEVEARQFPADVGAWAAPVCDWHPQVARESCSGYPHD
ncbi:hypothetical protein [Streptomyces himalayensis]|uniref:Uncharacterized protein n=1 Tax=Streptomyces himalayensis subsp. himalayensis TaxID=2756131 RepID=A0A7W0DUA5_9ACTN|nr:hypothetical protein [Streptomyces himalayensis]MBA2951413.1 hypothetical protein [Streptomyces himalayensis subsp. himalayensis]